MVGHDVPQFPQLVAEFLAVAPQPLQQRDDLALHLLDVLLDQVAAVDDHAAGIGDAGGGEAGETLFRARHAWN